MPADFDEEWLNKQLDDMLGRLKEFERGLSEESAVRTIVTMDGDGRLAIDLRHQGEGIGVMLLKGAAE